MTAQIVLIPGVTGSNTAGGVLPTVHGSSASETYMYNDGMRAGQHMIGAGISQGGWSMSQAASAELTYQTGAQSAEFQVGGVAMNAIPKEGGNTFAGTFVMYGAGSGVQSDNRTPELKAVIRDANRLIYTRDGRGNRRADHPQQAVVLPAAAPPAARTTSRTSICQTGAGVRRSELQRGHVAATDFAVDASQQAASELRQTHADEPQRLGRSRHPRGPSGGVAPEAAHDIHIPQVYAPQVRWTSPVSNRVFLEGGFSCHYMHWRHRYQPSVGPLNVAK